MLQPEERGPLLQIPAGVGVEQAGRREGHEQCTFDFCEHSRLDFTSVAQRHESCDGKGLRERDVIQEDWQAEHEAELEGRDFERKSKANKDVWAEKWSAKGSEVASSSGDDAPANQCATKTFDAKKLIKALMAGKPTAWALDGKSLIERPQPYMAISHVWSDGTGAGAWPAGQVNECLFTFFVDVAKRFDCEGLWWDTICIPREKAARSKAIIDMHQNYEDARITLVHDCFVRQWEWTNPEAACFAIAISPWFSRGWTALELAKSRKVKVMFRGGVIKDLNEDILATCGSPDSQQQHVIAASIIERLKETATINLDTLLATLTPRHTSWPRDVAIIAGQLAGIYINPRLSQQDIYQSVLRKIGQISHDNLFHNSITMSKAEGFTWCPTSMFDMPMSQGEGGVISIERNGNLTGEWDVLCVPQGIEGRYNWNHMHPLLELRLKDALENDDRDRNRLRLLFTPTENDLLPRALLVKLMSDESEEATPKMVRFIGTLYFHPPLTRTELRDHRDSLQAARERVVIAGVVEPLKRKMEGEEASRPAGSPPTSLSILSAAPNGDHERICILLKEAAANGDHKCINTLPKEAASSGDLERIKMLLNELGEASAQNKDKKNPLLDEDENTPLHLAVRSGHLEAGEVLLGILPNLINAQNKHKRTALHVASQKGHTTVVKLLIQHGAVLDVQDENRWTALHYATWNCYDTVVQDLLEAGASARSQDVFGQSALSLATERGNPVIVQCLLGKLENADIWRYEERTVPPGGGSQDGFKKVKLRRLDQGTLLHRAAWSGSEAVTKLLLDRGRYSIRLRINALNKDKKTPLHVAVENGYFSVAELLLQYGAVSDIRDAKEQIPLHLAAKNGHERLVVRLLDKTEAKTKVEIEDGTGLTPLLLAVKNGHYKAAKTLLDASANVQSKGSSGRTPLIWAAERGDIEMVRLLLRACADPNVADIDNQTPLLLAAENGHNSVAALLLENGAETESRALDAWTPLLWAVEKGYTEIVKLLLEKKTVDLERKNKSGDTPLLVAAREGHQAVVKLLLENEANPESKNPYGETPLVIATVNQHVEVVKELLKKGVDLEACSRDSQIRDQVIRYRGTPLVIAAEDGNAALVELLLKKGANVEVNGMSSLPLRCTTSRGGAEVLALLLEHGVKPDFDDNSQNTPISWAAMLGSLPMVKELLKRGAKVDDRVKGGLTGLAHVAQSDHVDVAKFLIDNGADIEFRDETGFTPLCWAFYHKNEAMTKLLLQEGANPQLKTPKLHKWFTDAEGSEDISHAENLGGRLLMWASQNGELMIVGRLLLYGVNAGWSEGNDSPLSKAAECGHAEIVRQLLLEKGVKEMYEKNPGCDPVYLAFHNNHRTVVKILLEKGLVPRAKSLQEYTILRWAEKEGDIDLMRVILKSCTVLSVPYRNGRPVLSLAVEVGDKTIVERFLDSGHDLEGKDADGQTPLFYAVGNIKVLELLLERGADRSATDKYGRTALSRAVAGGHKDAVEALSSQPKLPPRPSQEQEKEPTDTKTKPWGNLVSLPASQRHLAKFLKNKSK